MPELVIGHVSMHYTIGESLVPAFHPEPAIAPSGFRQDLDHLFADLIRSNIASERPPDIVAVALRKLSYPCNRCRQERIVVKERMHPGILLDYILDLRNKVLDAPSAYNGGRIPIEFVICGIETIGALIRASAGSKKRLLNRMRIYQIP
jgi:hypothetical protein